MELNKINTNIVVYTFIYFVWSTAAVVRVIHHQVYELFSVSLSLHVFLSLVITRFGCAGLATNGKNAAAAEKYGIESVLNKHEANVLHFDFQKKKNTHSKNACFSGWKREKAKKNEANTTEPLLMLSISIVPAMELNMVGFLSIERKRNGETETRIEKWYA